MAAILLQQELFALENVAIFWRNKMSCVKQGESVNNDSERADRWFKAMQQHDGHASLPNVSQPFQLGKSYFYLDNTSTKGHHDEKNLSVAVIGAFLCIAGSAFAGSDDAKWVAKCISDNKDEKVSIEVITKYCTCMNNKMDDNETQSITQWEKTHPAERAACDKESGWK